MVEGIEGRGVEYLGFRQPEHPDSRSGNDAEYTLAADEQVIQVRSGGVFRNSIGGYNPAVGQDYFQSHHLVSHGAKGRRPVAHAVGGDGAGDSGDGYAVRVVAGHQALFGQLDFQGFQNHAPLHCGCQVACAYLQDSVHSGNIKNHTAPNRDSPAHHSGSASVGNKGEFLGSGQRHNLGYLLGGLRPHHGVGQPIEDGLRAKRPEGIEGIGGIPVQVVVASQHIFAAYDPS